MNHVDNVIIAVLTEKILNATGIYIYIYFYIEMTVYSSMKSSTFVNDSTLICTCANLSQKVSVGFRLMITNFACKTRKLNSCLQVKLSFNAI